MGFSSSPSFEALSPKSSAQVLLAICWAKTRKKLTEIVQDIATIEDGRVGHVEPEQLDRAVVDLVHQRPELKRVVEVVFGQKAQNLKIWAHAFRDMAR